MASDLDFSGEINYGNEKSVEEWKEQANINPVLQENNLKVVNKGIYKSLIIFAMISVLAFSILAGCFIYLVSEGKFQSQVSTELNPNFNATVNLDAPSINTNNINPTINIYPNITIKISELKVNTNST